MEKKDKTLDALKTTEQAIDQANAALNSAIQELDIADLGKVTGAGEFDSVPKIKEHPYDPKDKPNY